MAQKEASQFLTSVGGITWWRILEVALQATWSNTCKLWNRGDGEGREFHCFTTNPASPIQG